MEWLLPQSFQKIPAMPAACLFTSVSRTMFTAALLTIVRTWSQLRRALTDECCRRTETLVHGYNVILLSHEKQGI